MAHKSLVYKELDGLGAADRRVAMVGVAQLVEPRVVIPVVVGSSPIVHPRIGRL